MVDPGPSPPRPWASTTTTPQSGRRISSRYLEAVSRGRHRDYASFLTPTASTPNRPSSKRPRTPTTTTTMSTMSTTAKLNVSNTSSGMTATTAALDISESWSSKGTPSRPDSRNNAVGKEGGSAATPIHHHHHRTHFSLTTPNRPLGIEGDCSSIDSASSHHPERSSSRPAHILLLDHDDRDPLKDDSYEDPIESSFGSHNSPLPTLTATTTTTTTTLTRMSSTTDTKSSPYRLRDKAREHWARRNMMQQSSKTSVKDPTITARDTHNNNHNNNNHNIHPKRPTPGDFFPRTTPSARTSTEPPQATSSQHSTWGAAGALKNSPGREARRRSEQAPWNRTRSRWESKQFADQDDDDDPRLSEAGAPTEIMTNRASDVRKSLVPHHHSESGAPTEVATNRAADLMMRRMYAPKLLLPPEPQEPPSVKRWSGVLEGDNHNHNKNPLRFSLIDTMSTHDESSALSPERPYTKSLIDVHSPTLSTSTDKSSKLESLGETQSTHHEQRPHYQVPYYDGSTQQSDRPGGSLPWHQREDKGKKTFSRTSINDGQSGGPVEGPKGTQARHHEEQVPQVDTHVESIDESYPTMSPVRFYVLDDHMPQPRTPQETLSGEVTSSVSTTDKLLLPGEANEHRTTTFVRYNSRQTPNAHEVFQRRCSADDSSHASTISTLDKEQEAGYSCCENAIQPLFSLDRLDMTRDVQSPIRRHHRSKSQGHETNAAIDFSTPPRSKSFDETLGEDEPTRSQVPKEQDKLNAAHRFGVVRDSPDPIFCSAGSLSFSSHGFESSLAGTYNKEGVVNSRRSTRGWATLTRSESTGTGFDEELQQIMENAHDNSTLRGSTPTNASTQRTGSVQEKIQAFNRIPPRPSTAPTDYGAPIRAPRSTMKGDHIKDEKKQEFQNHDDDETASVKGLKERFERPAVLTHTARFCGEDHKNKNNNNNRSSNIEDITGIGGRRDTFDRLDLFQQTENSIDDRSLQERLEREARKLLPGLQGRSSDDARTIRSLQEKVEEALITGHQSHDGNDDSVRLLRKKFEGKSQTRMDDCNYGDVLSYKKNLNAGPRAGQTNQNLNHDFDDRSVSSLKKRFEGKPAKQGRSIDDERDDRVSFKNKLECAPENNYVGQSGEDDNDDRSVQSLKKKSDDEAINGKRFCIQITEDNGDDRSVSSLKKKFENSYYESVEGDGDDRSVSSLKKKFEGGKTKGNPFQSREDDSDDRSVSSLKKKFEVGPTKRPTGELVGNLKSVFESKMISHGKRSLQNSWVRPSPTGNDSVTHDLKGNMPPRGTRNFRAPQSYVQNTRFQQRPGAYTSASRTDNEPCREHQENVTQLSCPPELYDGSIGSHIMKNHIQQSEANIPEERVELETLSTTSSKVRGPTATSFVATRDRLLQFTKGEPIRVEALPLQPANRAAPPSMQQRLNRWATRYQAQKTPSPVSLHDDPPDPVADGQVDTRRLGSYEPSSLEPSEQKRFDLVSKSQIVRNLECLPRKTELELIRSDSASTTKAHFVFDEDVADDQQAHISRSHFRGKSMDTEDSDGVTLDASIAEVSILSDTTMVKPKESRGIQALDYILGTRPFPLSERLSDTPSSRSPRAAMQWQPSSIQRSNEILDDLARVSPIAEIDQPMQLHVTNRIGTRDDTTQTDIMGSGSGGLEEMGTTSFSYDITPEKSFITSDGSNVFEKKASGADSGWDIETVTKSFSYDITPQRSFVTAGGSHVSDSDVWPPLDDSRWFDFSDTETNSVNAFVADDLARGPHGTILRTKNASNVGARQGRELSPTNHVLDRNRQDDSAQTNESLMLFTYSVDTKSGGTDYGMNSPARHASSQINGPIRADGRAADATPPRRQSGPLKISNEDRQNPTKLNANMIRLFSRTHPSSHASGVQSSTNIPECRIHRTKRAAMEMNDTTRSKPCTSTRISHKVLSETPTKNGGGLFSRVAWSLSRSSTNHNLISRLKSVKASRRLRKKSFGHLPGHKPLRDEDDLSSVQSDVEEGSRAASPHGNSPSVMNELALQTSRSPPRQDSPKVTKNRTPPRRDPPGVTKQTSKPAMDMRSIIPTASEEFHPRRISRRQMPVHTFNATSKVSSFFKIDAPRSLASAPAGPSSDEIRRLVGMPPPPPPRSTDPIAQVIGPPSLAKPGEEPATMKLATVTANQILEASQTSGGTERTTSFRARYCEAATRSTSMSTRPSWSAPRVSLQPTMKPPLPPSTRHSSFGSAQRINSNSLFGRVRYQDEVDRESSSSSNTSGFSRYFLD